MPPAARIRGVDAGSVLIAKTESSSVVSDAPLSKSAPCPPASVPEMERIV